MSRFERTSGSESSLPVRLRAGAGSNLERRVLDAAAHEEPSRELCERMALAIGVSPPPLAPGEPGAPDLGTSSSAVSSGPHALLSWLSAGLVVAVVAAILATRSSERASAPARSIPAPVHGASASPVPAPVSSLAVAPAQVPEVRAPDAPAVVALTPPAPRSRSSAPAADIQEQIVLIDAARAAVAAGASKRALGLVRQYQSKYPGGSFRPEAAALKIEALGKMGRSAEARRLAEGFAAEYGGGPLAERVSRLTERAQP